MALKKKTVNIGKEGIPNTISQIAKKFGTTVKAIQQANPNITNVNKVRLGQRLVIPSPKTTGTSKDPYKGMTAKQMSDMDVKNKDMKRQRRVTRDIGARGMDTGSAGKAATKPKSKAMALPKPKPKKKPTPVSKSTGSSLSKEAIAKAKARKNAKPLPKSKPKAKPKKELTEVQKKSRAFFSKLGKELMRKGPKNRKT
mgnify:CR=1 FL=1